MRRALLDREKLEDARCAEGGALDLGLAIGGGAVVASQDTFYVVRSVRSLQLGRPRLTRFPEHNLVRLVVCG